VKTKDGNWVTPSGTMQVTWTDKLSIKIASNPSNYKLELMDIQLTTNTE